MAELQRGSRRLEWRSEVNTVEFERDGLRATYRLVGGDAPEVAGALSWIEGPDGLLRVQAGPRSSLALSARIGDVVWVHHDGATWRFELPRPGSARRASAGSGREPELRAPMTGTIRRVLVQSGESVTRGQPLLAIEAMKMEQVLKSPGDAVVEAILCREGETVDVGDVLLRLALADRAAPGGAE